ncbi:type II toxin-antitoxin system prevent-host-death family antitoxin [Paraburkholderia sp.]|uniref:type II toxin-antitoxin system prevent-host-death family antitoxin n=1 Tax=Paraburkholderia sp. TaxID=1926495 RepID=UPI003D6EA543
MKQFFWQQAVSMATRDFSRNPSKALREASTHPVMVTKYGQPVACLIPIDYWNSVIEMLRNIDISTRLERRDM